MRNFLIHEYLDNDEAVAGDVITNDLAPLTTAITDLRDIAAAE